MKLALVFFLCLGTVGIAADADYFAPRHRVSGIGVDRENVSPRILDIRTDRLIESQTFSILRDPQAVPGAKRITGSAALQSLFRAAGVRSGLPPSLIEAIAYLESWGDPRAQSPAGPRGIMQISAATARSM
jgi:hypothetical protein